MSSNTSKGPTPSGLNPIMNSPLALPDPLRYTYSAYLVLIIIVGVPGNILIALVYGRTKTKNTCDWFILSMSVTDCTVCLLSPILHLRHELQINEPWMSGPMCGMEHWLQLTAMLSSCHYLTAIAIDRYVKICNSRLPTLTPKVAPYACLVSFLSSAVICVYPSIDSFQNNICGLFDPRGFETSRKVYFTVIFCGFVICFILVTFAYWNVCQQIFIKVKNKQRLIEQNGLHDTSKTEQVEETAKPIRKEFRVNSYNCLSLRLFFAKCIQTIVCCHRHKHDSNGKVHKPSECSREQLDMDQIPLTNTVDVKQRNVSQNFEKALTANNLSDMKNSYSNEESHSNLHNLESSKLVCDKDTQKAACEDHYTFQLEKEDAKTQCIQMISSKSDGKNLYDMADTKMTLLSLTTASWPSTEDEPTPSADVPVSFYLEHLISQTQSAYLKETKDMEHSNASKGEDTSVEKGFSKECFEKSEVFKVMDGNLYVNKISLLDEAEALKSNYNKGYLRHPSLKCSLSVDNSAPANTILLKSTKSQPVLSNIDFKTINSADCMGGSSLGILNQNKSLYETKLEKKGAVHNKRTKVSRLTKSLSVDDLWSTRSVRHRQRNVHQARGIKRETLTMPSQLDGLRNFSDCVNNQSAVDKAYQKPVQYVFKKDKHQPASQQTLSVGKSNIEDDVSETATAAQSITPKNGRPCQNSYLLTDCTAPQSGTSPCHIATPTRPLEDTSRKRLLVPQRECLEIPPQRYNASLKSTNSCSVDSETGADEIEEDMPTGSFMQKWRSQVRRKAKSRQRKGLTSSGKSMSTGTGKLFAREKQITFMLISVTLTFLLASVPSWVVWVAVLWEPSVMSRGLWSRLIFVATVGVYLLNFISSYFIFYAFNPTFRSKCLDLLACTQRVKADHEGDKEEPANV